jgi:TetR/AcrR family transcriptional regulator
MVSGWLLLAMRILAPARLHARVAIRDPKRTRDRILAAALEEFSAHGLAGARVDRIARRARINKRMLYHYFGDKEDLFREILGRKLRERAMSVAAAPHDPSESLVYWFAVVCHDRDWVRLMQWEALGGNDGPLIGEAERRRAFGRGIEKVRDGQDRRLLDRHLDARQLLLSMMALTTFPLAFPQITRLVTGHAPGTACFQKSWAVFLRRFAASMRPEHGTLPAPLRARLGGRG